jgi:hypothetical protein
MQAALHGILSRFGEGLHVMKIRIILFVAATSLIVISSDNPDPPAPIKNKMVDATGQTRYFYCIVGDNRKFGGNPDLKTAEDDAEKLYNALKSYPTHPQTVDTLFLGERDGYTKATIKAFFDSARVHADSGDELVFYYTGHASRGTDEYEQDGKTGIIGYAAGGISDDELKQWCEGFRDSVTINIIIDACYAGEFLDDTTDFGGELAGGGHPFVIAACDKDEEITQEKRYTLLSEYHSISWTTKVLLPALERDASGRPKADISKDGGLEAYELFSYAVAMGPLYTGNDDCDSLVNEDDVEHNDSTLAHEYIDNDGDGWADEDPAPRSTFAAAEYPLECYKEGDPGFYGAGPRYLTCTPGEVINYTLYAANLGFLSSTCTETDTFCVAVYETEDWDIECYPPTGTHYVIPSGYSINQSISIVVPCDVGVGDTNIVIAVIAYTDVSGNCSPYCDDCEDPNWYDGAPYYSVDTLVLEVVEPSPNVFIMNDSIAYIDQGVTTAYVPFMIGNPDPCSPPRNYGYQITSMGYIGDPINMIDSIIGLSGGDFQIVYAVMDAELAVVGDTDLLSINSWALIYPSANDSSVQEVEVVEPEEVPLLSYPAFIMFVVSLLLVSGVILLKRFRKETAV